MTRSSEEIANEIEIGICQFAVSFVVSLDFYRMSQHIIRDLESEFNTFKESMLKLEKEYEEAIKLEEA